MLNSLTEIGIGMKHRRLRRCIPILSALVLTGFTGCSDSEQQAKQAAQMKALQEQVATAASDLKRSADALVPSIDASRAAVAEASKRLDGAAESISAEALKQLEVQQARLAAVADQLKRSTDALGPGVDEGRRVFADAARQIADVAASMGKEAASIRELGASLDQAMKRLDEAASALANGAATRAKKSAELGDQAAATGRLADAILLMTSAAMTDPSNAAYATRLAELAMRDPAATPESLSAAATALRALSMQCEGQSVISVWRSAETLDAKAAELLSAAARRESELAVQEASESREEACRQIASLVTQDFLSANDGTRNDMTQRLFSAIEESGDQCAAAVETALATLGRWRRIARFDESMQEADRALKFVDSEQKAGRSTDSAASAVLASAEAALRTIWSASETEVGPERWRRASILQSEFASAANKLLEARDSAPRAQIAQRARQAVSVAAGVRQRLGSSAPRFQRGYDEAIKQIQAAMVALAKESATLGSPSAIEEAGQHQLEMQQELRQLSEGQYKSLCEYVSTILKKQIDLAAQEKEISETDALLLAEPLYAIDPSSLPGPLAETYGSLWRRFEAECYDSGKFAMTKARLERPKIQVGEF